MTTGVGGKVRKMLEALLNTATGLALCVMAYVALRPGGVVRQAYADWADRRALEAARRSVWSAALAEAPIVGSDSASERVVLEFADYQCPYCRAFSGFVDSIARAPNGASIRFVHLPLPIHPAARGAALASICAQAVGRFAEMHHLLFSTNSWFESPDWGKLALQVGIGDTAAFNACRTSATASARVDREIEWGKALQIGGTPTFISGNGRVTGADREALLKLIHPS